LELQPLGPAWGRARRPMGPQKRAENIGKPMEKPRKTIGNPQETWWEKSRNCGLNGIYMDLQLVYG